MEGDDKEELALVTSTFRMLMENACDSQDDIFQVIANIFFAEFDRIYIDEECDYKMKAISDVVNQHFRRHDSHYSCVVVN